MRAHNRTPLPPPRQFIADPGMTHGAYRQQPGYRPPRRRWDLGPVWLTLLIVGACVVGLPVVLVVLIFAFAVAGPAAMLGMLVAALGLGMVFLLRLGGVLPPRRRQPARR